jgi:hypothetical protein
MSRPASVELILSLKLDHQVAVVCDGQESHSFQLDGLFPDQQNGKIVLTDPNETGQRLFSALFPAGSIAFQAFEKRPRRTLLVAPDPAVHAIPWKYLYGPDGYLVLAYRLYTVCERKGWAQEALAYNMLVVAWPRIKEQGGKSMKQESLL